MDNIEMKSSSSSSSFCSSSSSDPTRRAKSLIEEFSADGCPAHDFELIDWFDNDGTCADLGFPHPHPRHHLHRERKMGRFCREAVAVLAASWISVCSISFTLSFGDMFAPGRDYLHASDESFGYVASALYGLSYTFGIMAGFVSKELGIFKAIAIATTISVIGLITASFATSAATIAFPLGVLTPIGIAICYVTACGSMNVVFTDHSRRIVASAIVNAASAGGVFGLSAIHSSFSYPYWGWPGVLRVQACLTATAIIAGAAIRPSPDTVDVNENRGERQSLLNPDDNTQQYHSTDIVEPEPPVILHHLSVRQILAHIMTVRFTFTFLYGLFAFPYISLFLYYIPQLCKTEIERKWAVPLFGIVNCVARLLACGTAFLPFLEPNRGCKLFWVNSLFASITVALTPLLTHNVSIFVPVVLFSMFYGFWVVGLVPMMAELADPIFSTYMFGLMGFAQASTLAVASGTVFIPLFGLDGTFEGLGTWATAVGLLCWVAPTIVEKCRSISPSSTSTSEYSVIDEEGSPTSPPSNDAIAT